MKYLEACAYTQNNSACDGHKLTLMYLYCIIYSYNTNGIVLGNVFLE